MHKMIIALMLILASSSLAVAQDTMPLPAAPTGQNYGGAVRADAYTANTSTSGFGASSLASIVGAGTTQATATIVPTTAVILTACPAGAGISLPAVERYTTITVMNRSGAACLVYPTVGATVETAIGTNGAVNAPATVANNSDAAFRLVSPTAWNQ